MDTFQILLAAILTVNVSFFLVCVVMKSFTLVRLGSKKSLSAEEADILKKSRGTLLSVVLVRIVLVYGTIFTVYHFGGWLLLAALVAALVFFRSSWGLEKGGFAEQELP